MNLPFQSAGSQSSILMAESALGARVAATRQKAGNVMVLGPKAAAAAGISKTPAGRCSARVMVAPGKACCASWAQASLGAAAAVAGDAAVIKAAAAMPAAPANITRVTGVLPNRPETEP